MTDSKNTGDKTLSVGQRKPLGLRRSGDSGMVRQSFSHGRTKPVVVEKKRRRISAPGEAEAPVAEKPVAAPAPKPAPKVELKPRPEPAADRSGMVLRTLTDEEKDARAQALADSRQRETEERRVAEEEARRRAAEDDKLRAERAEAEARRAEEESRRKTEDESRRKAEVDARERLGDGEAAPAAAAAPARKREEEEEGRGPRRVKADVPAKPVRKTDDDRRRTKLTVTNAFNEDERGRSLASMRRRRAREKSRGINDGQAQKISREVTIPEVITVQELANRMAEKAVDVIRLLMQQGQMLKINDVIDSDSAQLIAEEMGHTVRRVSEADVEEGLTGEEDSAEALKPRAPVVTIMGHVDHGKTSLLDALRKANVVAGEAGGITQHIGAYQIATEGGQLVTFIDTPGHEAFTAMRARGARVTDIVVLVVAADDGVMPQTVEAINHARAAEVPIIVAVNKIDKPDANPDRVRNDLLRYEIVTEAMGGEVQEVPVSALKGTNLDQLLDSILLQAEILELKANPDRPAEGVVVEAKLDKGRGPVATVLVQRGTLRIGDVLVAGSEWGKVRALVDDHGENRDTAGPAMPIEVLGLNGAPEAGDVFVVVENEGRAREICDYRQRQRRELQQARIARKTTSLEQMMSDLKTTGRAEFPLVIKGDVQGSVEAIAGALDKMSTDEVLARVIHSGVGAITESDVTLAEASKAAIIGFNVRANKQAREAAEQEGVEIRYYNVIYDLVDDVKAAMSGMLSPELRETMLGNAEILEIFDITKVGKIAGCRVTDGTVQRGAHVRLIRDGVVIHEGKLSTLKRFKDEVREVQAGQECGMAFENYQDMRAGDVIECFRVEEIARTL
ncbi:MAG: translation initiation factor IF-2 [Rhodobiaceae bacterium]|nr:translation initiation factor IF-2 [Rhodobiaceae bacterium]